MKCPNCDATIIKPNPTFVYIKCWKCRELVDVRKPFTHIDNVMKAMQMMAKAGVSINEIS